MRPPTNGGVQRHLTGRANVWWDRTTPRPSRAFVGRGFTRHAQAAPSAGRGLASRRWVGVVYPANPNDGAQCTGTTNRQAAGTACRWRGGPAGLVPRRAHRECFAPSVFGVSSASRYVAWRRRRCGWWLMLSGCPPDARLGRTAPTGPMIGAVPPPVRGRGHAVICRLSCARGRRLGFPCARKLRGRGIAARCEQGGNEAFGCGDEATPHTGYRGERPTRARAEGIGSVSHRW